MLRSKSRRRMTAPKVFLWGASPSLTQMNNKKPQPRMDRRIHHLMRPFAALGPPCFPGTDRLCLAISSVLWFNDRGSFWQSMDAVWW